MAFGRFLPFKGSSETYHPLLQKAFLVVRALFTKEDVLTGPGQKVTR